jgi:hypothetical protein
MHIIYFHVTTNNVVSKFIMQMDDESSRLYIDQVGDSCDYLVFVSDTPKCQCYFCDQVAKWSVCLICDIGYELQFGVSLIPNERECAQFGVCMKCVLNPWMMFWNGTVKDTRS